MSTVTYICHDDDGKITAQVSGPEGLLEPPSASFVQYEGDSINVNQWYVVDGFLSQKPEQPSKDHSFDYQQGVWVLDFEVAKQRRWDGIKKQRGSEEFGVFEWGGYTFQCDEVSQRRIQGAVQLAALDGTMTLDWTLADNTVQTFTAAEYVQIGVALANHVSGCHERGRILRQEIETATTESELEAIVW